MVEILYGLARSAFAKIVETRNDDEAATGAVEDEAEVSEIGVRDVLDFRKRAGFPDADHRAASVGFAIKSFDGVRGLRLGEFVPGLKDSGVAKAECAAEIDDFDASFEEFRRKFGRHIVRRCEKRGLGASGENIFERKLTKGRATDAAELGKEFRETVSALRVPHEKRGG